MQYGNRSVFCFFLFELFSFLLHYILDVNGIEWNGAAAQLWYVETLQAIIIEGWFLLWKNERLVSLALAVYIAEVRLAVKSVVTFAAKTNHLPVCDQL